MMMAEQLPDGGGIDSPNSKLAAARRYSCEEASMCSPTEDDSTRWSVGDKLAQKTTKAVTLKVRENRFVFFPLSPSLSVCALSVCWSVSVCRSVCMSICLFVFHSLFLSLSIYFSLYLFLFSPSSRQNLLEKLLHHLLIILFYFGKL